jgi:cobalamin biosynthesis protein CbiG
MDMITHQAKGVDAVAESLDPLLDQKEESSAVLVIEENRLTTIPP